MKVWATDQDPLQTQDPEYKLRPHLRQFVIGPAPFRAYDDWCCLQIEPSTWVSYCPHLRIGFVSDAEGSRWCLLGLAVQTLADQADPLTEIAGTASAAVPQLYPSWAGRWVLIGGGQVHLDATGRLGCFYGRDPDRRAWVSSSPALLAPILGPEAPLSVDGRSLQYATGISWFTPPRSRFAGMFRLLPSQTLDLNDGTIRARPLMPPIDPSRDFEEILALLQSSLVTTLQRLSQLGDKLWLGLTAGCDSRVILAIARHARIDIRPFTRVAARMSVADRLLPPKLARECGYEHRFLWGRKPQPERRQLIAEHSAGHVSDGDGEPFVQGVRDGLEGICLGGHSFEVASGFGSLRQLPETVGDPEVAVQQIAQLFNEPLNSTAIAGIREWLDWALQTPHPHLDWRDRFYIEQRQAGWASAKEQVYDMARVERFFVLNAARNYSLLLGLPSEQRLGAIHQIELIRRIVPELLQYPFNPPDQYFGTLRVAAVKSASDPLYGYRKVAGKLERLWHSLALRG